MRRKLLARAFAAAMSLIFAGGLLALTGAKARAEATPAASAAMHRLTANEFSAQSYRPRRAPNRVRVYRRLGPNSVRVCNARYEREYRQSGTVIVPRLNCYWRG